MPLRHHEGPQCQLISGSLGELGYTDIIVRHLTTDQPKVLRSLERLEGVRAALG